MGEQDITGDRTISEQPYAGVLFKSQNDKTWTAVQSQDLKFKLLVFISLEVLSLKKKSIGMANIKNHKATISAVNRIFSNSCLLRSNKTVSDKIKK